MEVNSLSATSKMRGLQFVLIAVLAVGAFESRAAEIPKSADKIDLRLFVDNGAIIAKNLFTAINAGLDKSKPNAEKILNELAPEAKASIRKIIDAVRGKIKEEETRVDQVFNLLKRALDDLKPIKPCSDKVSPDAKKLALATEKEIVKIVQAVKEKYKKEIQNVKVGAQKTLQKARNLFDTEVKAVVACLKPGRKDAYDCVNKEIDKTLKEGGRIVTEVVFLVQTSIETLSPAVPEVLDKIVPLFEQVLKNGRVLLKKLGDCIATLK